MQLFQTWTEAVMSNSRASIHQRRRERGQTIILVAVALVSLLAMAARAIDVVTLYVAAARRSVPPMQPRWLEPRHAWIPALLPIQVTWACGPWPRTWHTRVLIKCRR